MPFSSASQNNDSFRSRLDEKLFKTRTLLIFGEITQELARDISEQLLVLSAESDKDIKLFINSQGGHVESGDTIYDMIQFVKPKVNMIGTGWVASAGALIYLAVPLEQRFCLPNTRFLLHQPSGGVGGQASDIGIEAKEIVKMKRRINQIIAKQTGQPLEKIEKDTDRNFWMNPGEAKEYGLLSKIIQSTDDFPSG
ncbi:MAG: ATP-dependent Clp protease proteolytic subunit [bacterium]